MENTGILNWRSWSIVRKSQVIGTLTGALLTIAIVLLGTLQDSHEPYSILDIMTILTMYPAVLICRLFAWTLWLSKAQGTSTELSLLALAVVAFINSCLFFFLGTITGYTLLGWRARRRHTLSESNK
jgi:hypothetical protein